MKRFQCMMVGLFILSTIQNAASAEEVLMIGHSLVNHNMPRMFSELAGEEVSVSVQLINGSPLKYNWENSNKAEGGDGRELLATGKVNVLVLTEAVPLDNHLKWSDSHGQALNFASLAVKANPNVKIYIYETWHCINSGTPAGCSYDEGADVPWRDRLNQDLPKWEGISEAINTALGKKQAVVLPAGQAMALLHDRIEKGDIPGLTSIKNIFSDDIHLTETGNYFIALVHYAAIQRKSPVGLTASITNPWGAEYNLPNPEAANALQQTAWDAVREYYGNEE